MNVFRNPDIEQTNSDLEQVNLADLDVSKVDDWSQAFENDKALTTVKGLGTWDVTNAEGAGHMFADDPRLKEIDGLDGWKKAHFRYIDNFVLHDISLGNLDLSGWKTNKVIWAQDMFNGATA